MDDKPLGFNSLDHIIPSSPDSAEERGFVSVVDYLKQ